MCTGWNILAIEIMSASLQALMPAALAASTCRALPNTFGRI